MVANVNKKNNKDNNRMIRIDERASNGQQAASKWTMGGMVLFTGRTLSTFEHDDFCQLPVKGDIEILVIRCKVVHGASSSEEGLDVR